MSTSSPPTADVLVVSMPDAVLLMVNGPHSEENQLLVGDVVRSLVVCGTPAAAIDVLWRERSAVTTCAGRRPRCPWP